MLLLLVVLLSVLDLLCVLSGQFCLVAVRTGDPGDRFIRFPFLRGLVVFCAWLSLYVIRAVLLWWLFELAIKAIGSVGFLLWGLSIIRSNLCYQFILLHNFIGWMEFLVVVFPLPAQGLFRCCSPEVLSVMTEPLPYPGECIGYQWGSVSALKQLLRFYLESVDLMSHLSFMDAIATVLRCYQ